MKVNDAIHTLGAVITGLNQDPSGTTVSVRARKYLPVIDGYVVGGGFRELRLSALPVGESGLFTHPEDWGAFTGWLVDLPNDTTHVGAWRDGDELVFDSVTIYQNADVAFKVAKERGEDAVYDGYRQRAVSVTEPQY